MDCTKLPVEAKTPGQIALDRCNCLIDQYLGWKIENHRKSNRAQSVALIFTGAIPVVLLLPWQYVNIVGAAFSAIAAIATGLLAIGAWRDNFIRYGYIYHMLQVEKYLYLAHATNDYPEDHQKIRDRNFAKRVEGLVTLDVTEWRTEMQRIGERSK